ncbi:DoxX family protein [Cellulomonas fimi]|uniref:DoxX family protein n=1 Tax=Cellulomonas fimi TaxID=1708 RepID=UPI00234C73BA|nr:DoxX family protein [Cellulomonas fimi]MDC7120313.1 DoxX family protein [Cellulomonas fimi]
MTSTTTTNRVVTATGSPVPDNTLAAADRPAPPRTRTAGRVARTRALADDAVAALARVLTRHSVTVLRISLGLVFLGFGVLKFFPGVSPAAELAQRTIGELTLGLVGPTAALLLTAVLETVIGLTLVTGRFLRTGLVLLAGALVGIMSPLVLFFDELFPAGGPTIVAQYVLKDVVLAAAGAVIAAVALGARLRLPGE